MWVAARDGPDADNGIGLTGLAKMLCGSEKRETGPGGDLKV